MNVNGLGAAGYPTWQGARKAENNAKGDFGTNVKATGNVVHITPDALFSIYDAKTGESANVYRADNYSEENPLYIVKGMDKNGNEYEQTVDVSKVRPLASGYVKAETGNKTSAETYANWYKSVYLPEPKAVDAETEGQG